MKPYSKVITIMNKFNFDDHIQPLAEEVIDGYLINPLFLPNGLVPSSPFIIRTPHQISVHCLNTEAEGEFRCWGIFDTLDDALHCAKQGPFGCDGVGC
jgi:hypothetical protein